MIEDNKGTGLNETDAFKVLKIKVNQKLRSWNRVQVRSMGEETGRIEFIFTSNHFNCHMM